MGQSTANEQNYVHLGLYLIGGILLGSGIISLYWSFGWEHGDLNGDFRAIGYTGLDNIALLSTADYSILLVVVGILSLVAGNATAWRETGGY